MLCLEVPLDIYFRALMVGLDKETGKVHVDVGGGAHGVFGVVAGVPE